VLAFFLLAALFFWRFSTFDRPVQNGRVEFTGTLLGAPKVYYGWQYFNVNGYKVKAKSEQEFSYGDKLQIVGEIEKGRLTDPKIEVVGSSKLHRSLFSVRRNLKNKIFENLSEPQASLLAGVTLGAKENLPKNFQESLRKTGTIHVVVVSGYNISVVAGLLIGLSRFIKRQIAIVLALLALTIYTLLVGADPPAVRAAIMGAVTFTAVFLGRQRFSLYSLFLAAGIMTFVKPLIVADIGFQLSFLATAGIILFREKIFNFFKILPKAFNEDLSTTLAAQSLVIPVLFYHFGSVSAISPVANALVLWTIPLATILGFTFLAVSFVAPLVAVAISWVIWAVLTFFVWLVEFFGQISFAQFSFTPKEVLPLVIYYIFLVGLILYFKYVRVARSKQT
jgi:competence protein ComEC